MKLFNTVFLLTVLGAVGLQAQVANTPATIYLVKGGNPQGFITASAPRAIKFATTATGAARVVQLSEIRGTGLEKGVRLEARSEVLADPRAAFSAGQYLEAAKGFAKVVSDYQGVILNIPQNFASEAMFYQVESLRRLGNYKILASLLDSPAGKSMDTMLSDRYKESIRMQKLWATYGSGDMSAIEKELESYQQPVVGQADLLPAPNFREMPQSELVQVAFMRAKVFESKGEKDKALQDYFRVFSMAFANEAFLSKQAMGASMVIQAENPKLKSDNEKVKKGPLRQMQSVAYFFSKRFPDTTMPSQFQEYAEMPEVDVVLAPKQEEPAAEEAPKEGEAPKADAAASDPMNGMDTDGDGKLSEKEWLAGTWAKEQKAAGKNMKKLWRARDKNKSGFLEAKEIGK